MIILKYILMNHKNHHDLRLYTSVTIPVFLSLIPMEMSKFENVKIAYLIDNNPKRSP